MSAPDARTATDHFLGAIDYVAAGITMGVFAGFITWTAAIATAVWAVFRAMNEINRWRDRRSAARTGQ